MSDLKTRPTHASVAAFLNAIEDDQTRKDCKAIAKMMREITGKRAKMWGPSIVGFDTYHYKYASKREGDWPVVGFSPRKQNLTLYVMAGFTKYGSLMNKLGKHQASGSCLRIKKLEDVNERVLRDLITRSVAHTRKIHA